MDAKNLIIPAGLMYYSYSSNAALEKMLQQQQQAISDISSSLGQLGNRLTTVEKTTEEQGNTLDDILGGNNGADNKNTIGINTKMLPLGLVLKTADLAGKKSDAALVLKIMNRYTATDDINFEILGFCMCSPGIILNTNSGSLTFEMMLARDSSLFTDKNDEEKNINCGMHDMLFAGQSIEKSIVCKKQYIYVKEEGDRDRLRKWIVYLYNKAKGKKIKYYSSIPNCTVTAPGAGKCTIKLHIKKKDVDASLQWVTFRDVPVYFQHFGDINSYPQIGADISDTAFDSVEAVNPQSKDEE